MERELTLMAVHAHPDDEVLGTGGVLARHAEEGIRTVLVTCTNGEQGDGPGGVKPGEPGHDEEAVRRRRLAELRDSAVHLDIGHVELLGYRDSGMEGWEANHAPDAFANVPVDEAARRLAGLMERYRPQVVVTYDERGGYGHPDHIQAHRITMAAAELTGIPDKLYYTAVPREGVREMFAQARELGIDLGGDEELPDDFGVPADQITTTVDVGAYADRKRKALQAHASQGDSIFLLRLPEEVQLLVFGTEHFIRHPTSRVQPPTPETDLFAGLR
ncbi:PIG-L family deacetylase [Thermomonospora cellulosilytica]|uniref:LmbE family N-acetylglucosaminyl deacetylase n=1 Tax=Thermomonospora cellulosilytica TaxID=1411118 RepID=A0A7W3MZK5_9ACTN|nr:PIG-L family deacetylase [Thermomonospora cellulosilytica]MBA9004789.1 LmbE family N-acetylglucosaminyl deacetylase [Thermomonospora cellulosilytica]